MQQSSLSNKEKQQQINAELIQAIRDKKDLSIIEEIITRGADINCADKDGTTPLHWACEKGLSEIAKILIERGGYINRRNKDGWTPLHWACVLGHSETAKIIIDKGANVNYTVKHGVTALHYACQNGHSETVKILIDKGCDFNQGDMNGGTSLHAACENGHSEIAKILIEKGGDINQANKYGWNALHWACFHGYCETPKILIERGADVNYATKSGKTPIQFAVENNKIELVNLLFESGADVSCLNQAFIDKNKTKINQETKDLIAKITQAKNIKKRDENLERKKIANSKIQQEKKGDLVSSQMQEELNILKSKVDQLQKIDQEQLQQLLQNHRRLIDENKQQVDGLKLAIDQQLALASNVGSGGATGVGGSGGVGFNTTLSSNINPRFIISTQDLAEIKYIQNNPELNDYYMRMQKCFNEAFLFSTIVSQGAVSIEEQSRIVNSLENISSLVGDIPFASLIVNQFKYGASEISKAKTKGQQGNFSDMVVTSDSIESSLLAERIARRFTASRELNEQARNQIIANASEIKDQGRMQKIKTYLVAGARKYLTRISPNLERGFLGEELSPTNQLALSDFEKAVEFIFNKGISPEIKGNLDEINRHQQIAKEIVSKAIELEAKDYNQDKQALGLDPLVQVTPITSTTQITQEVNSSIIATTSTSEIEVSIVNLLPTPAQMMEMMKQSFAGQLASELSEFKKQQEEETKNRIEELQQQHQRQIDELNQQRQDDRQRTEQQFQTQQEERKKHQDQISKLLQETQEIQTNQDKLKKLTEIADFAPDLEITIGKGYQATTMKLGDLMKDQKNKTNNLEQNLGAVFSQIQNRLEDLQLQIENQGEGFNQRPSLVIRGDKSGCCLPTKLDKCVLM